MTTRHILAAGLLAFTCATSHATPSAFALASALRQEAEQHVAANQFEPLLTQADAFLKSQERLPDGRWKLAVVLGGMRNALIQSSRNWEQTQAALEKIPQAHPKSPNAWLMPALGEYGQGWQRRGDGTASEVGPTRLAEFHEHLARARDLLDRHPAATNPAWADLRLRVANELGEPFPAQDRLFRAAIKQSPAYQQLWLTQLSNLRPQWGGSEEAMAGLIREAAQPTSSSEGRSVMARLLVAAQMFRHGDLVDRPDIGWSTAKASFDDLMKRYPDDGNAQVLAFLACEHADKAETQRLLDMMKGPPEPGVLGQNDRVFGLCIDWARGRIAEFAMRDHERGTVKIIK